MFTAKLTMITLLIAGLGTSTRLYVNDGCIIANNKPLCAGGDSITVDETHDQGWVDIWACITPGETPEFDQANCKFGGKIPTEWDEAFYGAGNCLYGAGNDPIKLGCSSKINATDVACVYDC